MKHFFTIYLLLIGFTYASSKASLITKDDAHKASSDTTVKSTIKNPSILTKINYKKLIKECLSKKTQLIDSKYGAIHLYLYQGSKQKVVATLIKKDNTEPSNNFIIRFKEELLAQYFATAKSKILNPEDSSKSKPYLFRNLETGEIVNIRHLPKFVRKRIATNSEFYEPILDPKSLESHLMIESMSNNLQHN